MGDIILFRSKSPDCLREKTSDITTSNSGHTAAILMFTGNRYTHKTAISRLSSASNPPAKRSKSSSNEWR